MESCTNSQRMRGPLYHVGLAINLGIVIVVEAASLTCLGRWHALLGNGVLDLAEEGRVTAQAADVTGRAVRQLDVAQNSCLYIIVSYLASLHIQLRFSGYYSQHIRSSRATGRPQAEWRHQRGQ